MLRQLLRLALTKGSSNSAELAEQLGISEDMVRQMLEQLKQLGYLQQVVRGCGMPCEGCPLRAACLYHRQPRIWSLTQKGERWLRQGDKA